jgi:hypothetical protein
MALTFKHFVWISFDLGIKGDYEGMYVWLDKQGAKECGDNLACFSYSHPTSDILKDIKDDLGKSVALDTHKNRIYVVRVVDGQTKGSFIFGSRRNPPWAGASGTGERDEDHG